jgi:molecular chaperone Hsp33
MEPTDRIARGLIGGGAARVVAVVATHLVQEAVRRHDATGPAAIAMGRAAVAGLLLATLAKDEERVTLQILGQGPLGAVTVDASGAGTARVFVTKPQLALAPPTAGDGVRASIGDAVGRYGVVNVIRDLGLGQDFNGQTPLVDGEIDTDVESYLCRSEQIDSALVCEAQLDETGAVRVAAGVLVQALPHSDGSPAVAAARARFREGALARLLAETTTPNPTLTPAELLAAGLAEDVASLKRLDERPVAFECPCSRERAASTLALLGEEDLLNLIREEGEAEVTCEFCRARYLFTDTALEEIRHSIRRHAPPPS